MTPETSFCSECGRPTPTAELARFGDRLVCGYCKDAYAQKLREGVPAVNAVRYGGFWIRFVAYIIDGIVLYLVASIVEYAVYGSISLPTGPADPNNPFAAITAMLPQLAGRMAISTAISLAYFALFWWKLGATPGMLAFGLRVVRPNGAPIGPGRAVGRYFAILLNMFTLYIGFIIAGFDKEKRGLHDMICDTRVIYSRG